MTDKSESPKKSVKEKEVSRNVLISSRNLICCDPIGNDSSVNNVNNMKTISKQNAQSKKSKRKMSKCKQSFVLKQSTALILKNNNYEIQDRLGVGAFSEVFKAYNSKLDLYCAVKVIDLSMMNENFHTKFLPREIKNLSNVRHPHIIRIYDIFRISNRIFIFMEFASKGDLTCFLKKLHKPLNETHACKWFYQMLLAMDYLHNTMKIAHRDIKIDNILIANDNTVKFTDFGFSLNVAQNEDNRIQMSKTFCGTRPYLAPQIVLKKPYNPFKADVWALGVVLFSMLNNRYPYHYKDRKIMLKEQFDKAYIVSRFTPDLTDAAKDLLVRMFEVQEECRLDIKDIFQHEWIIKKYDENYTIIVES